MVALRDCAYVTRPSESAWLRWAARSMMTRDSAAATAVVMAREARVGVEVAHRVAGSVPYWVRSCVRLCADCAEKINHRSYATLGPATGGTRYMCGKN